MDIPDYINEDIDHIREEEENSAYLATAQRFYDEAANQIAVARNYPRNSDAIFAENWLREQGVW